MVDGFPSLTVSEEEADGTVLDVEELANALGRVLAAALPLPRRLPSLVVRGINDACRRAAPFVDTLERTGDFGGAMESVTLEGIDYKDAEQRRWLRANKAAAVSRTPLTSWSSGGRCLQRCLNPHCSPGATA